MTFTKENTRAILGIILVIIIAGGATYYYQRVRVPAFPIATEDHLSTWSFTGAYTTDALVAKAKDDIAHLESLMGKGEYDDYDLNVGIAVDYEHLGDGKMAYVYFNRAIKIHPEKGLAYMDMGNLMNELKAYATARDAYAKATAVEPGQLAYHVARITYLTERFPKDNALVSSAFADASKVFGDNDGILMIEAQWLTSIGRYADAIKAWKVLRVISPKTRWPAIDLEIARLEKKI